MKQIRQPKNWLTVKGVADYCLVSRVTVRRWIKDGKLSATRLPSGHYRINLADFRQFLGRYNMPLQEWLFKSESKRKEVTKNGSADSNGAFRTGGGSRPDPG